MQSSFTFARWLLINKLQFDSDDVRLSTFDEHTWAEFLESEHSHSIISSIAPLLVDKPKTTRKPAIKKNKTTRVDVSTLTDEEHSIIKSSLVNPRTPIASADASRPEHFEVDNLISDFASKVNIKSSPLTDEARSLIASADAKRPEHFAQHEHASGDAPLAEQPIVAPKKKTVKKKNVTEQPVQETVVDAAPTDESLLQLEQPVVAPKKKTVKKKVAVAVQEVATTEESVPTDEPVVDAAAPTEESVLLQEPALTEQPVVAPKKKTVKKKAAVAATEESAPAEEPVVDTVVPTEEPVVAPKKKTVKKKAAVAATEESAPTEEPVVDTVVPTEEPVVAPKKKTVKKKAAAEESVVDAVVPTEESVVAPKKKTIKKKEPIAATEESVVAPKKKTNKKIVEETLAEPPVDVVAPTDDSLHAEPYEQTLLTEEFINDTLHYRDDNTGTLYSIDTDGNLVPI